MGSVCTSPFIGSGQQVAHFCRLDIVPAFECKMRQCLLHIAKTDTPVIVPEHLSLLRGYLDPILNTTFIGLNKAAYLNLLVFPKTQPLI